MSTCRLWEFPQTPFFLQLASVGTYTYVSSPFHPLLLARCPLSKSLFFLPLYLLVSSGDYSIKRLLDILWGGGGCRRRWILTRMMERQTFCLAFLPPSPQVTHCSPPSLFSLSVSRSLHRFIIYLGAILGRYMKYFLSQSTEKKNAI